MSLRHDATLQATMASCCNDIQDPGGARHDFEKCVMLLLPACPVAKTRKTTDIKRPHEGISSTSGSGKAAMDSSVVHLRWHEDEEFRAFSPEQKTKLTEWRNSLSADESAAAGIPDWAKDGNRRPGKKQKRSNGDGNCRNLLSVYSRLNRIDPSTNIFPPNPERGYRTSRITNGLECYLLF